MNRTPYLQQEYVVTLCLNKGHSEIITECLAIDSKTFPELLNYEFRANDSNIVICLKQAAREWYEVNQVGIINFWYKDSINAYLDPTGNVTFDND